MKSIKEHRLRRNITPGRGISSWKRWALSHRNRNCVSLRHQSYQVLPKQLHHVHACVLQSPPHANAYDDPLSQLGRTSSHKLDNGIEEAHELYLVVSTTVAVRKRTMLTFAVLRHVGRVRAGVRTLSTLQRFLARVDTIMSRYGH